MIEIKELTIEDKEAFCEFERRYKKECGKEKIPSNMNPDDLEFEKFLERIECCKNKDTLPKNYVLANYYMIYVDGRMVGGINLRRETNEFILNYAGHIGYCIAPWERNKGYAKQALKRVLLIALDYGIHHLLLTADESNIASQKVILSCGATYEKTFNGKKFYWFHLKEYKVEESAMAIVFYKEFILSTIENIYGNLVLSLPKGHIESGETRLNAAIRECYEETNIMLKKENFYKEGIPYSIRFIDHHNHPVLKWIYPICFKIMDPQDPKSKEERIHSVSYMNIKDFLQSCSYENVKEVVKNCLNSNSF